MPTILKLTKPLVAQAGDFIVINGKDVRVVPAAVLDPWLVAQESPRRVFDIPSEPPPQKKEQRVKGSRRKTGGRVQNERIARLWAHVKDALRTFPDGLTPSEAADLVAKDEVERALIGRAAIHNAFARGELEREPTGKGGEFRRVWRYKLKQGGV